MTGRVHRCGENARKGTGYGICDGILDPHGECSNAGNHVYSDRARSAGGDTGPMVDLRRWGKPGAIDLQTIWVTNLSDPERSGWGVYERGADGPCMVHPPCTEDEVKAYMAEHGYTRRPFEQRRAEP